MTSLGIMDMLDPRVSRPIGAPSNARQATPGGTAFAEVIQDAERLSADDTAASSADTAADDAPADLANTTSTTPVLPLLVPSPGPALAGISMAGPLGADTADAPTPADAATTVTATAGTATADDSTAAATDARSAVVPAAASSPATPVSPSSAPPTAAGPAAVSDAARPQSALADATRIRTTATTATTASPATGTTTAAGQGTGPLGETAVPTAAPEAPAEATPRRATSAGSTVGAPVPSDRPADLAAARPEPPAPAPDGSAEADAPAAPVGPVPATTPSPAATSSSPSGETPSAPAAVGITPPPSPVAAASALAAVPTARPALLPQLTTPVVALAQAPDGDHSLTLTVSPENLGPVTVRAHISGGAIHIELHAPNDLGREALRAILADLRRDLAAAAPHASLLLSTSDDGPSTSQSFANGNGSAHSGGTATGTNSGQTGNGAPTGRDGAARSVPADLPPAPDGTAPASPVSPHGGIDIFA